MADDSRRLVTHEQLEKFTGAGLTDRRYRQIADKGYFPKPINGLYDLILTNRGLVKYYKELQTDLKAVKQAIADEQHRELKRENDLADGLLVKRADVVAGFRKCAEPIRALLRQKLENEYPQAVAGLDVPRARIYGKRLEDDLLREFQKIFAKFEA